jgi:hypothetical protein
MNLCSLGCERYCRSKTIFFGSSELITFESEIQEGRRLKEGRFLVDISDSDLVREILKCPLYPTILTTSSNVPQCSPEVWLTDLPLAI